jgi:Tfp pilus assembly protein PilN
MLEKYYRINQAAGISIHTGQDGAVLISACGILAKDNRLDIDKRIPELHTADELKPHFRVKTFVALNLSGKGILQKQIEKTHEIHSGNFSKILPNANFDDFYIQNFVSGNQSFISVIRKAEADKWIEQLKDMGYIPLSLSLGPFPVQNIISQLNIYGNGLLFDGHLIERDDQLQWTGYRYDPKALTPFVLKIESETINEKLLVPYAAAFQLVLASNLDVIEARVPSLAIEFQKKLADNKLKVSGFLALAVLFVLLLANFFLFSGLNSANNKLTSQLSKSAQSTTDIQQVNDQVQQKEALLKTLGWESDMNKSGLIDHLASLLPQEITWKEAAIDPIDLSASRVQKAVVFFNREIRITGTAEKIIPVNEWIARIKTKTWVKNVQMDSYAFNSELNTGQFIILVDY